MEMLDRNPRLTELHTVSDPPSKMPRLGLKKCSIKDISNHAYMMKFKLTSSSQRGELRGLNFTNWRNFEVRVEVSRYEKSQKSWCAV